MRLLLTLILFFFLNISNSWASEATNWLKEEIDSILKVYKDESINKEKRFEMVEGTINKNFAGAGIGKFVAGNAWKQASKDVKENYIQLFKRHLALSVSTLMQSYSDQSYKLKNSKYDEKNKVSFIDMEIYNNASKLLVTWRVKKSKDRYFVIDLLVADISLVVTKRSEFNSMLKKVGNDLKKFNEVLSNQNNISYEKLMR